MRVVVGRIRSVRIAVSGGLMMKIILLRTSLYVHVIRTLDEWGSMRVY